MARHTRIEGDYSIVSVYRVDQSAATNYHTHRDLTVQLLTDGHRVRILRGMWCGNTEFSIELGGHNHAARARTIALAHNQFAYIVVGGGEAKLYQVVKGGYALTTTYYNYTTTEKPDTDYSSYMNGTFFKFFNP